VSVQFDSDTARRKDRIAREISDYVLLHPNASDTLEGVQRWWLPVSESAPAAVLELALDDLVARRVLSRRTLPDGRSIYSVNAEPPDTPDTND
jgi:hypothetical protein